METEKYNKTEDKTGNSGVENTAIQHIQSLGKVDFKKQQLDYHEMQMMNFTKQNRYHFWRTHGKNHLEALSLSEKSYRLLTHMPEVQQIVDKNGKKPWFLWGEQKGKRKKKSKQGQTIIIKLINPTVKKPRKKRKGKKGPQNHESLCPEQSENTDLLTPISLRVGIKDTKKTMSDQDLQVLKDEIVKSIGNETDQAPRFLGCYFKAGWLDIKCAEKRSLDWLSKTIHNLKLWEGAALELVDEKELPKPVTAIAWIPDENMDSGSITGGLEIQNPGMGIKYWKVLNRKVPTNKKGQIVTFYFDESSLKALESRSFILFLNTSVIYVSIESDKPLDHIEDDKVLVSEDSALKSQTMTVSETADTNGLDHISRYNTTEVVSSTSDLRNSLSKGESSSVESNQPHFSIRERQEHPYEIVAMNTSGLVSQTDIVNSNLESAASEINHSDFPRISNSEGYMETHCPEPAINTGVIKEETVSEINKMEDNIVAQIDSSDPTLETGVTSSTTSFTNKDAGGGLYGFSQNYKLFRERLNLLANKKPESNISNSKADALPNIKREENEHLQNINGEEDENLQNINREDEDLQNINEEDEELQNIKREEDEEGDTYHINVSIEDDKETRRESPPPTLRTGLASSDPIFKNIDVHEVLGWLAAHKLVTDGNTSEATDFLNIKQDDTMSQKLSPEPTMTDEQIRGDTIQPVYNVSRRESDRRARGDFRLLNGEFNRREHVGETRQDSNRPITQAEVMRDDNRPNAFNIFRERWKAKETSFSNSSRNDDDRPKRQEQEASFLKSSELIRNEANIFTRREGPRKAPVVLTSSGPMRDDISRHRQAYPPGLAMSKFYDLPVFNTDNRGVNRALSQRFSQGHTSPEKGETNQPSRLVAAGTSWVPFNHHNRTVGPPRNIYSTVNNYDCSANSAPLKDYYGLTPKDLMGGRTEPSPARVNRSWNDVNNPYYRRRN